MKRFLLLACLLFAVQCGAATPLTSLEYRISGSALDVSPAVLSVPKGIPGSIATRYTGDPALLQGAYLVGTLRGGGSPARELLGLPGQPLLLPALNVVGDYQLDAIQLVRDDGPTRVVLLEATPRSIPVRVFDEVLVSRVTSRPLSSDEIREKGIFIDEQNFRVTEFEVGLVLDGKTIQVRAPVVSPRARQSTEIIPVAELLERLAAADLLNQQIAESLPLPPEAQVAGIQIKGIAFQFAEDSEDGVGLSIPPIPALLVIPGNIGFLNQFFSVQVFTENAAPSDSGLSVLNLRAKLVLPTGTDRIAGTSDDPLRFARVGTAQAIQSQLPLLGLGPDGKAGTADDISRLQPGQGGQCEFLVEGLQEGLHVLDLDLTADLEGLAAGLIQVTGKAAGSVLVRNPRFSLAFSAPRTVRSQEPYFASVTILNTSEVPANEVSITLPSAAVSGAELLSEPTVRLGTILPGQSGTARFRLKALRTGSVRFSNLSFGEEVTAGQFRLSMGVDERGVELSPDSLAMPDDVRRLPERLLAAADRVLGQALSAATAPLVPLGVTRPARDVIRSRVLELNEAGQRLRFGDAPDRVFADLLLDWQGGRRFDAGFDQILRETEAGLQWREALAAALADVAGAGVDFASLLTRLAPDLAGRGEAWTFLADDLPPGAAGAEAEVGVDAVVGVERSSVVRGLQYPGSIGRWVVLAGNVEPTVRWRLTNAVPGLRVTRLRVGTDGTGEQGEASLGALTAGTCAVMTAAGLGADPDCDGDADGAVTGFTKVAVRELPPRVVKVMQDPTVLAGRPGRPCSPPVDVLNYGTVVGVLFSKAMTQAGVDRPDNFVVTGGNRAQSVQIQAGGRLALVNLRRGVSAIRPRQLTLSGVSDARGNLLPLQTVDVVHEFRGAVWKEGVAVNGRVLRADGSPAVGVPVTLTMEDKVEGLSDCFDHIFRVSQVFADERGEFTFDFVLAGPAYAISATDTTGLSPEQLQALVAAGATDARREQLLDLAANNQNSLLQAFALGSLPEAIAMVEGLDRALVRDQVSSAARQGNTNFIGLQFRGRGTVFGTVYQPGSTNPAANAAVNLFADPGSRELGRGLFTDRAGRFAFFGVPLGTFTLEADDGAGHTRVVSGFLARPGETVGIDLPLNEVLIRVGTMQGRVTEADLQTTVPGATVYVGELNNRTLNNVVATTTADADGVFRFGRIPEGTWDVVAFSPDGSRLGSRTRVRVSGNLLTTVAVDLESFGRLNGRVLTSSGVPVANALVAGGLRLTTTDELGRFEIVDIPPGNRTISAAITPERNPAFRVSRRGGREVQVLPGVVLSLIHI